MNKPQQRLIIKSNYNTFLYMYYLGSQPLQPSQNVVPFGTTPLPSGGPMTTTGSLFGSGAAIPMFANPTMTPQGVINNAPFQQPVSSFQQPVSSFQQPVSSGLFGSTRPMGSFGAMTTGNPLQQQQPTPNIVGMPSSSFGLTQMTPMGSLVGPSMQTSGGPLSMGKRFERTLYKKRSSLCYLV
jgi:hypothetical protein